MLRFALFLVIVLLAGGAAIFGWLWLMAIRSPCPRCGHSHQVIRSGFWLYPRFYCPNCRHEW